MAIPTKKHPEIEAVLTNITGDNRKEAITQDRCLIPPIGCGGTATSFRDELSKREYSNSGLCQTCQDKIFG